VKFQSRYRRRLRFQLQNKQAEQILTYPDFCSIQVSTDWMKPTPTREGSMLSSAY
jgi:hypothetical protein